MNKEKISWVTKKDIRKRTFLSFLVFALAMAALVAGWRWIGQQPPDNGIAQPLRAVLNMNESIFKNAVFSEQKLSKPYAASAAVPPRFNGPLGLTNAADTTGWKLQVVKHNGDTLFISLDELKALPKTEVVFDFKCIEGWSQVTRWEGIRFSDFVNHYHLQDDVTMDYTSLVTPDKKYYVGIDRKSMLQPQTILCYEMNGKPLPLNQGYPLRLIIPVKYGIKHLKRIGTISFSNERPADYWYERGYDYYAGL